MPMKIRAILDEAQRNSPSDPSYGFIQGAQGLIIINQIKPDAQLSYSGVNEERFPRRLALRNGKSSARGLNVCKLLRMAGC
jgi:hypothetical protein